MEKWKIAVIVLLLGGLATFGFFQNNPGSSADPNNPNNSAAPTQPKPPPPAVLKLVGKKPPAWKIPANLWLNTPRPIALDDLKGHFTLVEFWRANCPHCEAAAPFLSAFYKHYRPLGLRMVSFESPASVNDPQNLENNWPQLKIWIHDHEIPYPVAHDSDQKVFKFAYKGQTYPTILVIDPQGIVRHAETGIDDAKAKALEDFIAKSLKVPSANLAGKFRYME